MSDTRDLKWLAVKITPENREELQALSKFPIDDDPYICHGLHNSKYLPSITLVRDIEKLIPDFSKLPEIRLLISLGMSHREAFNKIYGDYVCRNLNG